MTREEIEDLKIAMAATISTKLKDFVGVPLVPQNVEAIQEAVTALMKDYYYKTVECFPVLDEIQWDVRVVGNGKLQVVPFATTDRAWYFLRGSDMNEIQEESW